MDKYFIDRDSRAEECFKGRKKCKKVKFPLCLAIQIDDELVDCADFLLNISKGIMFIQPPALFPVNTKLNLHFYIPPETKLLAEFKGMVIGARQINNATGNLIKIIDLFHNKLHMLEEHLEEKNHLVDIKV